MTNDDKKVESINIASLATEKMLADFLAKMGYISKPIPYESNIVIVRKEGFTGQPQRYLFSTDNPGFQSHAVVSIENGTLCVYYYQAENDLFRIWDRLAGDDIEVERIKSTIRSATTMDEILKRFYT
jgi:hypothetical protein